MSIKLSPDTLMILKNLASINQSLLFTTTGVLCTIAESKNILVEAKIAEKFPQDIGIYDLNEFLSVVSLFSDPTLEFSESYLTIKDDANKKASCTYFYADPSMLPEIPDKSKILKAIKSSEIELELSESDVKSLMKAAATLQSKNIAISSNGKKVTICTTDEKNTTANSFSLELCKGDGSQYNMLYKTENIDQKLLNGSYKLKISQHRISEFKHETSPVTYWVALEDSSTYESE